MKNTLKKLVWGIYTVIALSMLGTIPAYASDVKQVNIEGYDLAENSMRIYLNTDSAITPSEENLEIVLGDTVYTAGKVTSFADTGEAVSYLVLVDVSGSVTDKDIENTKEILTQLVEEKAEDDNISIVEIRNEIVKKDFLSDKEALAEQIQTIERTGEDTNLYLAVREALKILEAEDACHQKKCLIIISDGMDDQKNGILFEDVRDAIKESNVPICTLAMTWKGSVGTGEDAPDKVMKSFTENAAGGVHIRYEDTDLDNGAIAEIFSEFARGGSVAEISLEGYVPNGTDVTLSVELQVNDEMVQGDSYQIPSHEISAVIIQEENPEEAEVVEENPVLEEEEVQQDEKRIYWVILLIGIALVAGVGIAVYSKKKSTADGANEDSKAEAEKMEPDKAEFEAVVQAEAKSSPAQINFDEETPTVDGESYTVGGKIEKAVEVKPIEISLTEIGPEATRVLRGECENTLSIGRRKSAGLVIADDNQVSGMHCELRMEKGRMYLKDLNSTNGTFLNGVPVTTEVQVNQEDVIYIGAFEYRISWE